MLKYYSALIVTAWAVTLEDSTPNLTVAQEEDSALTPDIAEPANPTGAMSSDISDVFDFTAGFIEGYIGTAIDESSIASCFTEDQDILKNDLDAALNRIKGWENNSGWTAADDLGHGLLDISEFLENLFTTVIPCVDLVLAEDELNRAIKEAFH